MENQIREMAYFLWESAGKPIGEDEHFWKLAEQQFRKENKYPRGKVIKVGSETFTVKQWANRTGNPPSTIRSRLKSGKAPEKAIFERSKKQKVKINVKAI